MTVTVTDILAGPFHPNGVTTAFPFDFKVPSAAEVRVFSLAGDTEVELSSSLYSVNISSDEEGGTINFTLPPSVDYDPIFIEVSPDFSQNAVFNNNGFLPRTLNPNLDRAALRDIWLKSRIDRAPVIPIGVSVDGRFPVVLPGGTFGWSSGTGSDAGLREDLADDDGGDWIGSLLDLPGAVKTTQKEINARSVSPLDFGAAVTAETINLATGATAPFTDVLFREIKLPNGRHMIDSPIYLRKGQTLRGTGWGSTIFDFSGQISAVVPAIQVGKDANGDTDGGGQPPEISDLMLYAGSGIAPQIDTTGVAGWKASNIFFTASGIGIRAGGGDGFLNDCLFDVGLNHIFVAGANLKINGCLHYQGNYQVTLLSQCYDVQITDCQYEYFEVAAIYANLAAINIRNIQIRGCSFIQNGQIPGSNAIAISSSGAELFISGCTFRNLYGAGVSYGTGLNNRLVIENCVFDGLRTRNVAGSEYSQSTTMQGVQATNMHVTLLNCTFRNLPGQPITLGGDETSTLVLENCSFESCTGGTTDVLISNNSTASRVYMRNCRSDRTLVNSQTTVPVVRDFMACMLTNSTSQAISAGTSTALTFDTEAYDTANFHSTSSNPTRITVPPGVAFMRFTGTVAVSDNNSASFDCGFRKNGTDYFGLLRISESTATTSRLRTTSTGWVPVVAGDYFELMYDDSTAATVTSALTTFWAEGRAG